MEREAGFLRQLSPLPQVSFFFFFALYCCRLRVLGLDSGPSLFVVAVVAE